MSVIFENLKVLVIDDYEKMRKKLCAILEGLGITISEASNGMKGLRKLGREKFDVVFTDIVMPEMDGFELCDEIRRSRELMNIPIIAVSTHCDTGYIIKALRHGADDYIPKPADSEIVKRVITRVLTPVIAGD